MDVKHPMDQITYQKDNLSYNPNYFEIHITADCSCLNEFFANLTNQLPTQLFILVFNGIDPVAASIIVKDNLCLTNEKLMLTL